MSTKPIQIIYTGGTFGMQPSDKGYVPAPNFADLAAKHVPQLAGGKLPPCEIIEYETPFDSANAQPETWFELASRIRAAADTHSGFVVIHGTDTLAYTASALSFLLADLNKPVILTGSQIPLCEIRSDAADNLISTLQALATDRLKEVGICFGRRIMRGNRSTKVKATELDAFDSPSFPALVEIGTRLSFSADINALPPTNALQTPPARCNTAPITVLRLFPGIQDTIIDAMVDAGVKGIILRCYGVGTAPTSDPNFLAALKRANDAGVIVTAVSQCLQGRVDLGTYAAGSALADSGVVSGSDMTTEAAHTKMHVLNSLGLAPSEISQLMQQNLRGELTDAK